MCPTRPCVMKKRRYRANNNDWSGTFCYGVNFRWITVSGPFKGICSWWLPKFKASAARPPGRLVDPWVGRSRRRSNHSILTRRESVVWETQTPIRLHKMDFRPAETTTSRAHTSRCRPQWPASGASSKNYACGTKSGFILVQKNPWRTCSSLQYSWSMVEGTCW